MSGSLDISKNECRSYLQPLTHVGSNLNNTKIMFNIRTEQSVGLCDGVKLHVRFGISLRSSHSLSRAIQVNNRCKGNRFPLACQLLAKVRLHSLKPPWHHHYQAPLWTPSLFSSRNMSELIKKTLSEKLNHIWASECLIGLKATTLPNRRLSACGALICRWSDSHQSPLL